MHIVDRLHEANQAPQMSREEARRCMLYSIGPLAVAGLVYMTITAIMLF